MPKNTKTKKPAAKKPVARKGVKTKPKLAAKPRAKPNPVIDRSDTEHKLDTDSVFLLADSIGKTISHVSITRNELNVRFLDGTGIRMIDELADGVEPGLLICDDDLNVVDGAQLKAVTTHIKADGNGTIVARTDRGSFVVTTHADLRVEALPLVTPDVEPEYVAKTPSAN